MSDDHFIFQDAVHLLFCQMELNCAVLGVEMVGLDAAYPRAVVSDATDRDDVLVVDNMPVVVHY